MLKKCMRSAEVPDHDEDEIISRLLLTREEVSDSAAQYCSLSVLQKFRLFREPGLALGTWHLAP